MASDIFISYARPDQGVAAALAQILTARGHSVWWDQALRSGETYDAAIETALRAARVVIVLWSPASVQSRWVRSEASVALQQDTLLSVMIAPCQRPVLVELVHTLDLGGWAGAADDARLAPLLAEVAQRLSAAPVAAVTQPPARPVRPDRRWLLASGAAALAVPAGWLGWQRWAGPAADPATAAPVLVVLPFASRSAGENRAWLASGLAEEVRISLSQVPGLSVIGSATSEQLARLADPSPLLRQVQATHVLSGSVQADGRSIHVSAELADPATGKTVWAQAFDRPAGDLLALQRDLAMAVVGRINAQLQSSLAPLGRRDTSDAEAKALLMQARALIFPISDREGHVRRLNLIDKALQRDPDYTAALMLRSVTLGYLVGLTPDDASERARLRRERQAAEQRAVALAGDDGYVRARVASGLLESLDTQGALSAAEQALKLAPNDPLTLLWAGIVLAGLYPERALVQFQHALALNPFWVQGLTNTSYALVRLGRLDEAVRRAEQAMAVANRQMGHFALALAHVVRGDGKAARAIVTPAPEDVYRLELLAMADTLDGRTGQAAAALQESAERNPDLGAYRMARHLALAGDIKAALDWLERAVSLRAEGVSGLLTDPLLDPLRAEPRYQALARRWFPADAVAAQARRPRVLRRA